MFSLSIPIAKKILLPLFQTPALYPIIDLHPSLAYNLRTAQREFGEVLELADRRDLESRAARREGSNPSFPIDSNVLGHQDISRRCLGVFMFITHML